MIWIEAIKNAGLNVYVWTVDDEVPAKHLIQSGIGGITTNRPGWLRQHLNLELPLSEATRTAVYYPPHLTFIK